MRVTRNIVIGYLVIGVLFAIFLGGSINPLHLSTWGNVLLWLPLMVVHFFWTLILIVVGILLVIAILSMFVPEVKARVVTMGQKLRS